MKFLALAAMAILCTTRVAAQDPHFSQFFASPLTLNPALTGKFNGSVRVAGNYRNQWPTINNAFTTYTVSADANFLNGRIPEFDQLGGGLMVYSDKSGNGILQNNVAALSVAYHKALDEDGYKSLGVGFQAAYVSKSLDTRNLKFEDQLTPLGFTGVTSEVFSRDQVNLNYIDVNAGAIINISTDGNNTFYLGGAAYHLNRPRESFRGGNFFLEPRIGLHAGGMIPSGQFNSIHFSGNFMRQAGAQVTTIGGAYALNVAYDNDNPTNLYLGTWYRFGDAFIPYVGLEWGEFQLGYTYDVNTSSLKPGTNMRGGTEISLIYTRKHRDPSMKKLNCPKF